MAETCHHCGKSTFPNPVVFDDLQFCCVGCETVYHLIHGKNLGAFYSLYPKKGNTPFKAQDYPFLKDREFRKKWETFREGKKVQVTLAIPSIHCSACIWVLEHLSEMEMGILNAEVNFTKRKLHLFFDESQIDLQSICSLLNQLGYPPDFSFSSQKKTDDQKGKRSLWLKIGIAGFAFGNTMFLSIATYFETNDPWLVDLRPWFDFLMFVMSLPVVFYAANDYFIQTKKSLQNKIGSLDLPIALGISVLFLKSIHNAFFLHTLPYFDSLTGLVFFLLLGKFMQRKVYESFSFERDYKSFFPLAVSLLTSGKKEKIIPVNEIKKGDQIVLKPDEIIPVDAKAIYSSIVLDYSFVTGESREVLLEKGADIYAGGRVRNKTIVVEAQKTLDQSYLIQLWNKNNDGKTFEKSHSIADRLSRVFTPAIISISLITGGIWGFIDPSRVVEIMAAILIVACPCALALSGPFVLGNMLRYFGRIGFYLKNTEALLRIANTNHWVFDKTGTLTKVGSDKITFFGQKVLNKKEKSAIRSLIYSSNHPLSRALFNHLKGVEWSREIVSKQFPGYGLEAKIGKQTYRLGSAEFVAGVKKIKNNNSSSVYIEIDGKYRGNFSIGQIFRENIEALFKNIGDKSMSILSGDSPYEYEFLQKITPPQTNLLFEQNPFDKIRYIQQLKKTQKVLMLGDGLNDAGALKKSDAGIAISNQNHLFTPACDAILLGDKLPQFNLIFDALKKSIQLVRISLIFSLFYNLIGISIAVMGHLNPIIAAILMPLSSITVVLFSSLSTAFLYKNTLKKIRV